jgi:hypothetical protein
MDKLIFTLDGPGGIDQVEGFVIVADDALAARKLAAAKAGNEGASYWFREDTLVLVIGRALPSIATSDVVLRAFHAG